jgi:hypothetical protein
MLMGVTVISTSWSGVSFASLSTTFTKITPNPESVGTLSQATELKNIKYKNADIVNLFMKFIERESLS